MAEAANHLAEDADGKAELAARAAADRRGTVCSSASGDALPHSTSDEGGTRASEAVMRGAIANAMPRRIPRRRAIHRDKPARFAWGRSRRAEAAGAGGRACFTTPPAPDGAAGRARASVRRRRVAARRTPPSRVEDEARQARAGEQPLPVAGRAQAHGGDELEAAGRERPAGDEVPEHERHRVGEREHGAAERQAEGALDDEGPEGVAAASRDEPGVHGAGAVDGDVDAEDAEQRFEREERPQDRQRREHEAGHAAQREQPPQLCEGIGRGFLHHGVQRFAAASSMSDVNCSIAMGLVT